MKRQLSETNGLQTAENKRAKGTITKSQHELTRQRKKKLHSFLNRAEPQIRVLETLTELLRIVEFTFTSDLLYEQFGQRVLPLLYVQHARYAQVSQPTGPATRWLQWCDLQRDKPVANASAIAQDATTTRKNVSHSK